MVGRHLTRNKSSVTCWLVSKAEVEANFTMNFSSGPKQHTRLWYATFFQPWWMLPNAGAWALFQYGWQLVRVSLRTSVRQQRAYNGEWDHVNQLYQRHMDSAEYDSVRTTNNGKHRDLTAMIDNYHQGLPLSCILHATTRFDWWCHLCTKFNFYLHAMDTIYLAKCLTATPHRCLYYTVYYSFRQLLAKHNSLESYKFTYYAGK